LVLFAQFDDSDRNREPGVKFERRSRGNPDPLPLQTYWSSPDAYAGRRRHPRKR